MHFVTGTGTGMLFCDGNAICCRVNPQSVFSVDDEWKKRREDKWCDLGLAELNDE